MSSNQSAGLETYGRYSAPSLAYRTPLGEAHCGDSRELLATLPDGSVNLIMTSPPFALLRQKEYGNEDERAYVDWLTDFAALAHRKLREDGSLVVDLGGAYQRGAPTRSLYNFRIPIRFCDDLGFFLAQEFYWFNPAKLPSPIEWVNKRKIRAKDAVNTVWWFSKTEWPKADVRKVLAPYSDRMKKLLKDPEGFYRPKLRPSGHEISKGFSTDNGGAIPSNLLQYANTDSNGGYLRGCRSVGVNGHPSRFPAKLPEFFIKYLTEPGDLVVDIFAGSNTTGRACETLERRWMSYELSREYLAASAFRFMEDAAAPELKAAFEAIMAGEPVALALNQAVLPLRAAE
jgi:site-specific DNA-methyltransferase (cytosine-N4-specific)